MLINVGLTNIPRKMLYSWLASAPGVQGFDPQPFCKGYAQLQPLK